MAINQNNLIEAPVSIENLQQLVPVTLRKTVSGELQQVLSNNLGTLIKAEVHEAIEGWTVARRTHINMWARFKPVSWENKFTNEQLNPSTNEWYTNTAQTPSTWWKGRLGDCGITLSVPDGGYNTPKEAKAAVDTQRIIWNYQKPSGNEAQPFRITDFIQYKHDAIPPLSGLYSSDAVMEQGHTMIASVVPRTSEWLSLDLVDLFGVKVPLSTGTGTLENYHFTVAYFTDVDENVEQGTSADFKFMWVDSRKLSEITTNDTVQISIPFSSLQGGYTNQFAENQTYRMYGFLSDVDVRSTNFYDDEVAASYIPLPYIDLTEAIPFGVGAPPCTMKAVGHNEGAQIKTTINLRVVDYTVYTYGTSEITGATAWIARAGDRYLTPVTAKSPSFDITTPVPDTDPNYGICTFYYKSRWNTQVLLPEDYERVEDYIIVISGNGFTFTSPLSGTIQIEE